MRPSRLRRRPSFTLVELIVVIAVLLLLMAIVLPSFLGARDNAKDAAVQSNLTVAYHNAKASWSVHGVYPSLAGGDGLVAQLSSAEPGLRFVQGDLPGGAAPDVVGVDLAGTGEDQALTLCGLSASGRYYCLRANEHGNLTAAALAGERTMVAAAGVAVSRSTGSTLEIAKCYLADYRGESAGDCEAMDGEGAPTWTNKIAASATSGGDEGEAVAPELAWAAGLPVDSTARTATFAWQLTGTASVTCQLDADLPAPCVSPLSLSDLPTGAHTFTVRAENPAGQDELSATWTVLPAAPILEWVSTPVSSAATTATAAYSLTGTADSLTCELDDVALADCASPIAMTGLPVGEHTVEVHASNVSGSDDLSHTWQVYAVPTATFTSGPAQGSQTGATTATFGWTTTAATASECSLDGAAFAACDSPVTLNGLGVGAHQFRVRATGLGGQATIARDWEVLPQPTVAITAGPAEGSSSAVDSASFSFTTTNASSATCSLDGAAAVPCTSPHNLTNLAAGTHTFQVNAVSPAGTATSPLRTWTVQRTYAREVIASGPSHYYRMNEAICADTHAIVDQVGGSNGTYNGATNSCALTASGPLTGTTAAGNLYVSKTSTGTNNGGTTRYSASGGDSVGSAWNFPGSASWMGTAGSVEVWFKTTDSAAGSHFLFDKYNSVGAFFSGGTLNIYSYATASSHNIAGMADGVWHHLVVAVNGTDLSVFLDGRSRVTATDHRAGTNPIDNSRPFAFGWRISGSSAYDEGYFFNGAIDEVAFYPTALTLADAQAHYNARTR